MVLKIRLARFGRAHKPVYNIVVAHARTARNSLPLEVLGTYDPIPKPHSTLPPPPSSSSSTTNTTASRTPHPDPRKPVKNISLDISRAKYWLGVGAQPSDPARRLLALLGLCEEKLHVQRMKKLGEERRVGGNG